MATTILGKRYRVSEASRSNDSSAISTRRTRRAQITVLEDDSTECDGALDDCSSEVVDEDSVRQRSSKRRCVSRHSSTGGPRIALASREINSQILSSGVLAKEWKRPKSTVAEFAAEDEDEDEENAIQLPTPKTPRHRDALSKRVPVTPRHRIGLVGKPSTPRSSLTPSTSKKQMSVFSQARQLFTRNVDPGRLIGRSQERDQLLSFVRKCVEQKNGGSTYISGPPGTGKSALVAEVCNAVKSTSHLSVAHINCMSIKSSADMYHKLAECFLERNGLVEDNAMSEVQALLAPSRKAVEHMYLLVLDEIDHLLSLDVDTLYTLFEWSLQRSSHLIILGIANALDLTDRFLPLLKAKNLKPQLLPFLPYTATQIAEVITSKLLSLVQDGRSHDTTTVPFFQPAAIQLCSKKVASQTGDLRKAFDIIRRSLDVVELETRQKLLSNPDSGSFETSPTKNPLAKTSSLGATSQLPDSSPPPACPTVPFTPLSAPRVTIAHVSRVSASAFSNGTQQRLQTLNLQQKAALCALVSHRKRADDDVSSSRCGGSSVYPSPFKTNTTRAALAPPSPTVRRLHETYCALCKQDNLLQPLTVTEFADVIGGLETLGLVGEDGGKGKGFGTPSRRKKTALGGGGRGDVAEDRRIVSFISEAEVLGCLNGPGGNLLRSLLRPGDD